MKKIGLFYGPVGGSTERVAEMICDLIGRDKCDLKKAKDSSEFDLARYDNIIFGIATLGSETWQSEEIKSGWFSFVNKLAATDMKGKKVAIFGLGDQVRYPNHFVDAMGDVFELLQLQGVDTIGKVDTEGYEFTDSKAVVGNLFVGLPVDEDFESEKTNHRIADWVKRILPSFS